MPLNPRFERRLKGTATSVTVSSFELNQRVLLLHLGIRTWPLVHRVTKTVTISILAAAQLRSSDVFYYFTSKVLGQTSYGQRYCSATSLLWHQWIPKTLITLWRVVQDDWTNLWIPQIPFMWKATINTPDPLSASFSWLRMEDFLQPMKWLRTHMDCDQWFNVGYWSSGFENVI